MRSNKSAGMNSARPAQFRANPEITRRYRFISSAATLTAVSAQTLIGAAGVVASSATAGQPIFQSVRVHSVELWAPPASQGAVVTTSILWPNTNQSQPREVSDTTNSVTIPAHVRSSPPANSIAGFWIARNSTTPLFSLVAPSGTIIEVVCSLVMGDGVQPATQSTLVGATLGGVYYCSLDSLTAAGSLYTPVSLTTL